MARLGRLALTVAMFVPLVAAACEGGVKRGAIAKPEEVSIDQAQSVADGGAKVAAAPEEPEADAGTIGPCGKIAVNGPLGERVPALAGKLTLRSLAGGTVLARSHDLMSAPIPDERETRVFYEAGDDKLVVFVQELFATTAPSFEAGARRFAATPGVAGRGAVAVEPVTLPSGLQAFGVAPEKVAWDHDAVFLYGLLVESAGTATYVQYFVSPGVKGASAGCTAVARRLARTIAAGTRTLVTAAGTRSLDALGERPLELTVPDGTVVIARSGDDFVVHEVRRMQPLGGASDGILGIYIGNHASFHPTKGPDDRPVTLLGTKTAWHASRGRAGDRTVFGVDALVPFPRGGRAAGQVHVFAQTTHAAELSPLQAIAETLRVR